MEQYREALQLQIAQKEAERRQLRQKTAEEAQQDQGVREARKAQLRGALQLKVTELR